MLKEAVVIFSVALLCVGGPLLAVAQEEAEVEFASGHVTNVSMKSLAVEVFDGISKGEKVFVITSETILENIDTVADLIVGDEVFIDFVEEKGANVALNIYKDNDLDDEYAEASGEEFYGDFDNEQEEKE